MDTIKVTRCRDQLPEGWMDNANYSQTHLCGMITCKDLAVIGSCSKDLSDFPLTNCVSGIRGTLSDYCKRSCHTCGKFYFAQICIPPYISNL